MAKELADTFKNYLTKQLIKQLECPQSIMFY